MNETLEERLSMLMDGEVTPFETKRLVDEIDCNPHMKALWPVSYTHLTLPTNA